MNNHESHWHCVSSLQFVHETPLSGAFVEFSSARAEGARKPAMQTTRRAAAHLPKAMAGDLVPEVMLDAAVPRSASTE